MTPSSVSPSPADYDTGGYGPAGDGYGARFAATPGSSREDCPDDDGGAGGAAPSTPAPAAPSAPSTSDGSSNPSL